MWFGIFSSDLKTVNVLTDCFFEGVAVKNVLIEGLYSKYLDNFCDRK